MMPLSQPNEALTQRKNRKNSGVTMHIFGITLRIAIIISLAELFIMQVFAVVPHEMGTNTEALLDAALLVLISTPFIYSLVIKPFVIARDEAIDRASYLAYHDSLTDLSNRRFLTEFVEKGLAGCARHQSHGALMLVDLDDFKSINDSYGHDAGDAVLIETGKRLRSVIRKEDLVSRLGGDEFVITLLRLDGDVEAAQDKALRLAKKLHETLKKPIPYQGNALKVNSSVGIRLIGTREEGLHAVIRDADFAMYRAKHLGKGHIVFFEENPLQKDPGVAVQGTGT
jgi:diguanylate cyclase (GGDEF)-like protein